MSIPFTLLFIREGLNIASSLLDAITGAVRDILAPIPATALDVVGKFLSLLEEVVINNPVPCSEGVGFTCGQEGGEVLWLSGADASGMWGEVWVSYLMVVMLSFIFLLVFGSAAMVIQRGEGHDKVVDIPTMGKMSLFIIAWWPIATLFNMLLNGITTLIKIIGQSVASAEDIKGLPSGVSEEGALSMPEIIMSIADLIGSGSIEIPVGYIIILLIVLVPIMLFAILLFIFWVVRAFLLVLLFMLIPLGLAARAIRIPSLSFISRVGDSLLHTYVGISFMILPAAAMYAFAPFLLVITGELVLPANAGNDVFLEPGGLLFLIVLAATPVIIAVTPLLFMKYTSYSPHKGGKLAQSIDKNLVTTETMQDRMEKEGETDDMFENTDMIGSKGEQYATGGIERAKEVASGEKSVREQASDITSDVKDSASGAKDTLEEKIDESERLDFKVGEDETEIETDRTSRRIKERAEEGKNVKESTLRNNMNEEQAALLDMEGVDANASDEDIIEQAEKSARENLMDSDVDDEDVVSLIGGVSSAGGMRKLMQQQLAGSGIGDSDITYDVLAETHPDYESGEEIKQAVASGEVDLPEVFEGTPLDYEDARMAFATGIGFSDDLGDTGMMLAAANSAGHGDIVESIREDLGFDLDFDGEIVQNMDGFGDLDQTSAAKIEDFFNEQLDQNLEQMEGLDSDLQEAQDDMLEAVGKMQANQASLLAAGTAIGEEARVKNLNDNVEEYSKNKLEDDEFRKDAIKNILRDREVDESVLGDLDSLEDYEDKLAEVVDNDEEALLGYTKDTFDEADEFDVVKNTMAGGDEEEAAFIMSQASGVNGLVEDEYESVLGKGFDPDNGEEFVDGLVELWSEKSGRTEKEIRDKIEEGDLGYKGLVSQVTGSEMSIDDDTIADTLSKEGDEEIISTVGGDDLAENIAEKREKAKETVNKLAEEEVGSLTEALEKRDNILEKADEGELDRDQFIQEYASEHDEKDVEGIVKLHDLSEGNKDPTEMAMDNVEEES